jgi:hypothetical protein
MIRDYFAGGGTSDFRLAALQPYVINRMLNGIQARAVCKHPACENTADLAVQRDFVHLDETRRPWGFRSRARVANAWRDLQGAKLHRFINVDVKSDDAAGNLVEPGKFSNRILDAGIILS